MLEGAYDTFSPMVRNGLPTLASMAKSLIEKTVELRSKEDLAVLDDYKLSIKRCNRAIYSLIDHNPNLLNLFKSVITIINDEWKRCEKCKDLVIVCPKVDNESDTETI